MGIWLQNLIVAAAVLACVGYMAFQLIGTFKGRRSKFGSCCAKGCPPPPPASSAVSAKKVVFLPAEELTKRVRQRKLS